MLDTKFNQADKASYGLALYALFMNSPSLLHLQGQILPSNKTDQHAKCLFLFAGSLVSSHLWHNCFVPICHDSDTLKTLFTNELGKVKRKWVVIICEVYLWITKHKTTYLPHTQKHTQSTNSLKQELYSYVYCTSHTINTFQIIDNDQPTVPITMNGFQEARSIKS